MSIKELILNKGWAGTTLGRAETADRLNALLRPLMELMFAYDAAADPVEGETVNAEMQHALSALRADIGKISETVFSCGAVAYSGTDLEPSDFRRTGSWDSVREREQEIGRILDEEQEVEHQIRTRAVLNAVAANSKARLALIKRFG